VVVARSAGETLDRESGEEILAAARQGQPRAWELIFTEFAPAITRFAASRGVPDPEDVTQEVMEAAATRLDSFEGGWSQLRRWLFSIAHRRCADRHRRRYRRRELPTDRLPEHPDPEGGADAPVWARGAIAEIAAAMETLDERERRVVHMRIIDGLSVAQVAEATGLSAANVRVIQSRALSRLRSHVATNGGHLDRRFRLLPLPLAAELFRRLRSLTGGGATATASASVGPLVTGVAVVSAAAVIGVSAVTAPPLAADLPQPEPVAEAPEPPQSRPRLELVSPVPGADRDDDGTADFASPELADAAPAEEEEISVVPPVTDGARQPIPAGSPEDSTEASSEAVVPNGEPGGPDEVVEELVSLPPITPATLVDGSLTRALLALTRDIAGLGERAVSAVDGLTAGVVETVEGAVSGVGETVDAAVDAVDSAVDEVTDGVESVATEVDATVGAAVEGVTGTLRAVTEPDPEKSVVESAATATAATVEATVTHTGSVVDTVVDTVDSTVGTVVDGVESTVDTAVDTVTDTVDDVVGIVDGLIGGLLGGG